MGDTIKIRATEKDGITEVKALFTHPMETGTRKDAATGELVPAHFIQEVVCEVNGKTVMTGQWSGGISKNPYFSFKFKGGKKGDIVKLSWVDNQGGKDTTEEPIK
jgi:sulfur-oxidizing protein SoxZ